LRYLWRWTGLFVALITCSLASFFHQPAISATPLLVKEHFGGGAIEWGWACAAYQAGSIGGGILMSTWGGFKRRYLNLLLGISVFGFVNLARGLAPANAYWLYLTATLLLGPALAIAFASMRAILQSTVPPAMQGRVFAVQNTLSNAMAPLGLLTLGPTANTIGIQTIFVVDGVIGLLVALTWALLPCVRRLEDGAPAQTTSNTSGHLQNCRI
jgi:DHA3 family macrolide efflux protein-like MFS transporter